MKLHSVILFAAIMLLNNCSNLGLLDKLENPGGTTESKQASLMAFVSSVQTAGDMAAFLPTGQFASCTSPGLLRADCACQILATNAGLPMPASGKYIAYMSAAANDMTCRITGTVSPLVICGVPTGGPTWTNTLGQVIANGYGGLLSGQLLSPLNITETKNLSAATVAWTGTQSGGQYFNNGGGPNNNCGDWTVTSVQQATVGNPSSTNASWTNTGTNQACTTGTGVIYCVAKP